MKYSRLLWGAEIEIVSSIQSYSEFFYFSRTCTALEKIARTGRSRSLARRLLSQDCFLNSKDGKNCGSSRGLSGLVRLSECNDEVKHHLISCHLSKEVLSENELILARTGLFHLAQEDKQKMWICYRHRHTLGKFWRSAKVTCQYPGHAGVRKRIQGRDVITLHMSQDIQKLFGVIIPVGSGSFSNIFCYIFLSRDISARKEKKLFIRLRLPKYTSR